VQGKEIFMLPTTPVEHVESRNIPAEQLRKHDITREEKSFDPAIIQRLFELLSFEKEDGNLKEYRENPNNFIVVVNTNDEIKFKRVVKKCSLIFEQFCLDKEVEYYTLKEYDARINQAPAVQAAPHKEIDVEKVNDFTQVLKFAQSEGKVHSFDVSDKTITIIINAKNKAKRYKETSASLKRFAKDNGIHLQLLFKTLKEAGVNDEQVAGE